MGKYKGQPLNRIEIPGHNKNDSVIYENDQSKVITEERRNDKMEEGSTHYFHTDESKKEIKEDLLCKKAKELAKSFIDTNDKTLNSTQLRKFYMDVKQLERDFKIKGKESWGSIRPFVKMLKSKVAYAYPKNFKDRKIPKEFKDFMDTCVDNIKDPEDFEGFLKHFEAVVGYFYGEGGK